MAITVQHTIELRREPAAVYALLDDLGKTPTWRSRCTGIEKLDPGPNAVGHRLRYSYKDGGRRGVMDGQITARAAGERLAFRYWDKMMDVTVDFEVAALGARGTRLTHAIGITPKTFFAKLFSPLIRRALPKQTIDAMEKLRGLLE
jgi:hypothetical protein